LPAILALATLVLLAAPTPAAPAGRIVIHGVESGSRLRLTASGSNIVVDGYMAIEVDMGPSGDKVEVLDRLPLPLTAYLGSGSDKFIGNGEADTCYPQGGNDRLFGGSGADQLYGGPGFDYCDGGPGVGRSHECEAGPGH
jgi:RTX calcium-binding nonapeptide repeat (4 copies)